MGFNLAESESLKPRSVQLRWTRFAKPTSQHMPLDPVMGANFSQILLRKKKKKTEVACTPKTGSAGFTALYEKKQLIEVLFFSPLNIEMSISLEFDCYTM